MPKHTISCAILLALFTISVRAQDFRFGIHATPTINYVSSNDEDADGGARLLFGYGGIVEYNIANNYAITSGFEVTRRGGTLTVNDTTGRYSSGFLQLPVMLKMRTRQFNYSTYFAEFGLSMNFRTSDNTRFEPRNRNEDELNNYANFFNMTFRFGVGMEYNLGGTTAVTAGLNYNRSLFNSLRTRAPRLSDNNSYRLDYVALTLGLLF